MADNTLNRARDMSVKEQLMALGMKEEDFGRYESDLYVRVTPVSTRFLETYRFKNQVEKFIDNIEHVPFYDFPFAAMKEQQEERQREAEWLKNRIIRHKQEPQFENFPIDGLHTAFERYEKDGIHAVCGDWSVDRDISAFPGWWNLSFTEEPVARCVPSEDYGPHGEYGNIERVNDKVSDKNFSDICDIISSVNEFYRMAPQEREKINANRQAQGR